jgi:EKC/KEOPS complex subunit PCC1/LAGE3
VALESLIPDPELKPDQLVKHLRVAENDLVADFEAVTDRVLRVGVNSFMDSLALLVECIEELNEDALEN